jgi:hypothetical protein
LSWTGVGLPGDWKQVTAVQAIDDVVMKLDDRIWSSGLFICGHPKSGTSLLMTMLDSHPELVVYPEESHFFRKFLPAFFSDPDANLVDLALEYLLHIFDWNQTEPPDHQSGFPDRDYSDFSRQEIRRKFEQLINNRGHQPEVALPAAIISYGIVSGQVNERTKYWVEKTPYNEQYAEELFNFWPKAKCLHIIRDPRDNYASYKIKHADWTPEQFAYSWWRSFEAGERNAKRYGRDSYLVIRYEDLVQSPKDTIEEIIEFVGIQFDPILQKPTRAGEMWAGNSMFGDSFGKISQKPAGRYKASLSDEHIRQIEDLLRFDMRSAGFLTDTQASISRSIIAWMKRFKWKLSG